MSIDNNGIDAQMPLKNKYPKVGFVKWKPLKHHVLKNPVIIIIPNAIKKEATALWAPTLSDVNHSAAKEKFNKLIIRPNCSADADVNGMSCFADSQTAWIVKTASHIIHACRLRLDLITTSNNAIARYGTDAEQL